MFNWGGPVKEGIMHGIREPHQLGQIAGYGARAMPHIRRGFQAFKNIFGKTVPGTVTKGGPRVPSWGSYTPVTTTASKFEPGILGRDPTATLVRKGWGAVTDPAVKGKLATAARTVFSPTGAVAAYMFWPDGTKKTKEELAAQGLDQHGPFDHTKAEKKLTKKAQAAFAEAQRDTRVKKYLDIMGYDRSKKTAVADALIDASKIVSERGTLEKKNITRDLISPIIQATSKRFDKPEQIREAVGLMMVKGEIEKDISKEKDALTTKLTKLKIEGAEIALASSASFEGGLEEFLTSRKGKVGKNELTQMARLLANKHGDSFTVIEDVTAIPEGGTGIYMSGSDIYRVIDGNAQQLA
jgi:hypothetical protein